MVAEAAERGRLAAGGESPTSGCGAPLHQALPIGSGTPLDARKGWPKSWQYVEPKRLQVYIYLPYTQRAQVYNICIEM